LSEYRPRFVICRMSLILGLAVAVAAGLLYAEPAAMAATTYPYSADTTAPALRQGVVSAAGVNWNCLGSRCTTSGPWATPSVDACRALARQVGPVSGYGHKGRMLTAGELQQCNAGVPTGTPSSARSAPGPVVINADTLRYAGRESVVINADTLRYAGRGPAVINAGTLRYAGRGPAVINAGTLRYAGRGPAVINAGTLRYAGRAPVVIRASTLRYSGTPR
jgi:hypothetical protein